jgi:hypothetical protein
LRTAFLAAMVVAPFLVSGCKEKPLGSAVGDGTHLQHRTRLPPAA